MTHIARAYIALILCAGAALLAAGLGLSWSCRDPLRFALYLSLAVFAAGKKVKLPGVTGTSSVAFIFILLATTELSLGETLLIACGAALAQCLWKPKARPRVVQVTFSLAAIVNAAGTSYAAVRVTSAIIPGEIPLIAVIASIVYFAANTTQVAIVISLTEHRTFGQVFGENYQWSFPHYLMSGVAVGVLSPLNPAVRWRSAAVLVPLVYWLYRTHRLYVQQLEMERNHVEQMEELHIRTIEALALAIEAKDYDTNNHLRRVEVYAVEVGKELRLSEAELKALRTAALLHDIGKLAVPEHIISKPGRLTAEEFEKVKIHPAIGAQILERVNFPYPVVPIVRCHHEKWDGSGYPDGLKGEEIPLGARILSAVDCLDGLASDRPYRPALPLNEAIAKVMSQAGKSFDPRVVSILSKRYVELERLAKASNSGRTPFSRELVRFNNCEPGAGLQPASDEGVGYDFLSHIGAARQEAQNLLELAHELGTSLSLEETMSLLAARLKRMVPYDALAIFGAKGDRLSPLYVTGDNSWWPASLEIPIGQGLCGWVAQNKKPIINGNPAVEPGARTAGGGDQPPFEAALAIPLGSMAGTLGVLTLYRVTKDSFTTDNLRVLLAVAEKVAISIENAMRYRQAETSAVTDALTGLPNARSLFMHLDAELARCQRMQRKLAVLVFDLDGFKHINDRFGHLQGNRTLRAIANALKSGRREHDYVARMGGDEFVIILPDCSDAMIQFEHSRFSEIVAAAAREISPSAPLSVSMGAAHYPDDCHEAEQLLAEADRRMYINKQATKASLMADTAGGARWSRAYTRTAEPALPQDYKH